MWVSRWVGGLGKKTKKGARQFIKRRNNACAVVKEKVGRDKWAQHYHGKGRGYPLQLAYISSRQIDCFTSLAMKAVSVRVCRSQERDTVTEMASGAGRRGPGFEGICRRRSILCEGSGGERGTAAAGEASSSLLGLGGCFAVLLGGDRDEMLDRCPDPGGARSTTASSGETMLVMIGCR